MLNRVEIGNKSESDLISLMRAYKLWNCEKVEGMAMASWHAMAWQARIAYNVRRRDFRDRSSHRSILYNIINNFACARKPLRLGLGTKTTHIYIYNIPISWVHAGIQSSQKSYNYIPIRSLEMNKMNFIFWTSSVLNLIQKMVFAFFYYAHLRVRFSYTFFLLHLYH